MLKLMVPATCSTIPWGKGLYLAPWPVPAHLQGSSLTLPTAQVLLWAVPKSWREGLSWSHLPYHSNLLSIVHPYWFPVHFFLVHQCGYSHPLTSAWHWVKNATIVAATTITLLCAGTEDPSNHPMMPRSQKHNGRSPRNDARSRHNPDDRCRSSQSPGRWSCLPPGHSTFQSLPQSFPTSLTSHLDAARWHPSSNTTRTALKSSQPHSIQTALRPLDTQKKASCLWIKHQMTKSPSLPARYYLQRMGQSPWWWRSTLALRWT